MESLHDLEESLAALNPQLGGEYVFATVEEVPPDVTPFAVIREAEGTTVVIRAVDAVERGLTATNLFTRITAGAVTSLNSVGVTATITQTIASRGIPCNVIAGYYHDHFFVPEESAQEVIAMMSRLSEHAKGWLTTGGS